MTENPRLSDADLDALLARAESATDNDEMRDDEGPWLYKGEIEFEVTLYDDTRPFAYKWKPDWADGDVRILCELKEHADFVTSARTLVPDLSAALRQVREENRALREDIEAHALCRFCNGRAEVRECYPKPDKDVPCPVCAGTGLLKWASKALAGEAVTNG